MAKKGVKKMATVLETDNKHASEPGVQMLNKKPKCALVELPLGELGEGYGGSNRVDVQRMNVNQKRTLRRILRGLENEGATLNNGKAVKTCQDVFKYILDRVG